MTYTFSDRMKEWTSYAGVAVAALSAVIPMVISPTNHVWVQVWQGLQIALGSALVFVPQTAGTTAIENEAWTLLKAFSGRLPPAYAAVTQPLISELASVLAHSQTPAAAAPTPVAPLFPTKPTTPVPTTPTPPEPAPVVVPAAPESTVTSASASGAAPSPFFNAVPIPPKVLVDPARRPQR